MAHRYMNFMRKYAKVVLAIMGVVCMITFVVGPQLLSLVSDRPQQQSNNEVALTWTKGSVKESDLGTLRYHHTVAYSFLHEVIREAADRGGTPIVNGMPIQKGRQDFEVGIPRDASDEALVETMLMAEEARRMGIVVNYTAVKDYLRQLSSPELGEGDWLEIAQSIIGDSGHMTVGQLLNDVLPYELRAQHARVLANAGLLAIPPGEMWDYFNRLNRRVSIEAYPIEVAPLIAQVKNEPTPAEIEKLFEDGRYRDPNPALKEPGFRKPHRVAFTYVKVDFAPFLEAAKKTFTEEQIKEQYDKDISQGLHKVPELPATTPGDEKKDGDRKDEEKKDAEKKEDGKKEDEKKPADEKKSDEKPAEEKKSDEKKGEEKPAAPKEEGCQTEPAKAQPAEEKKDEKPVEEKAKDEKKDEKEKNDKKADEKPAEEPKKEQKFKPLSEVHDEILTRLAQPIAQEARTKAVKEVTDAINDYGARYRRWLSVKEIRKDVAQEPAKLDLEALAAKHGFKIGTTPLVDQHEVMAYDIGKEVSSIDMEAIRMGQFRMQSFAQIAFADDEKTYEAHEANSTLPDVSYIYFRTAEEKAADVKLDEVKKQVVEAWKKQRAFDLAVTDAQKLADKAKKANSLGEAIGDPMKVTAPPPFSWMTSGSTGMSFGEPALSNVSGVELAGQEFMQAVFALKTGEAGVAPNQSHAKVYVVRLVGQDPSEEILRQQFLETGLNFQVVNVAQSELMQTRMDWYREIEKKYHVTWKRPPRDLSRRSM